MSLEINTLYRFEEFELDPASRVFKGCGKPISIPPRAFDLLLYMLRNPGRLLSKEELMSAIWGDAFVEDGNLTQNVFLLRKALSSARPECKPIVTVSGRGYRFDAAVEEASAVQTKPDAGEPRALAEKPLPNRRTPYLLAAGILVALTAVLAAWFWRNRAVSGDRHQIVLADFENTTGDAGFEKALNVALAIDLKQSPFLEVASETKARDTLKLMEHPPGEKLTAAVTREVCQRINAQAALSGIVARLGGQFLVTLTASDCITGQDLVQTRAVAANRDGILKAVDSVAAEMRERLGEPLKTLRQFSKPLLAKETNSLEALKAYTEGHDLGAHAKFQESVPLLQRAIELDPKFAIAWGDLGVVYYNLGQPDLSAAASRKAYELRDLADEPDRLFITASYQTQVLGDLHAGIRTYETWTQLYPRAPTPWVNLANDQIQIGRHDLAVQPARNAIAIDEKSALAYVVLARAQIGIGRFDDAVATCRRATAQKLDGAEIHGALFALGFARNEPAIVAEQIAWARGTPSEPYITLQQFLMTFAEGRPKAAEDLLAQLTDGYKRRGLPERATRMRGGLPRLEAELGMTEAARKVLAGLPAIDGSTDIPVALAEVGETSRAEELLSRELKKFPESTLWQYILGPQIQASIALSRNKPEEAITALRKSVPYDFRSSEVPAMRGRAFLAAGQPALAEAEFRKIIDHPGVEPLSANHALAHLGLARALALKGDLTASGEEYARFFAMWKNAEPDVPVLRLAKVEYGKILHQSVTAAPSAK